MQSQVSFLMRGRGRETWCTEKETANVNPGAEAGVMQLQAATWSWKRQGINSPLESSEGVEPCQHLDFSSMNLISCLRHCKRINFSCFRPFLLLQHPQETNTLHYLGKAFSPWSFTQVAAVTCASKCIPAHSFLSLFWGIRKVLQLIQATWCLLSFWSPENKPGETKAPKE